jgi:TrmH family RNA methyltransferase
MKTSTITSTQNQFIKECVKLHKAAVRKSEQLAFVEGTREVSIAQQFNWEIQTLLVCEAIYTPDSDYQIDLTRCEQLVYVSLDVYKKLSYRDGTEGICALVKTQDKKLKDLPLQANSSFLVLESLEKPGNIGAILRTADAAGVDAVILSNPLCDAFNPNVIRSSLGCVFAVPIISAPSEEVIEFLSTNEFQVYSASLQTDNEFYQQSFTGRTALVFGSEANGLTEIWYKKSKAVKIPMRGKIDSLNVGASAAIMLFEVVRQKLGNE